MSEKNTSSILETIKKKLHKLDKKSESNDQPTQVDDEFQYISSGDSNKKNSAPEKLPSLNDAPEIKSSPKVDQPAASSESMKSDILSFDDLDLDNEEGVSVKSVAAPSAPVTSSVTESKLSDSFESSPMDWLKETNDKPTENKVISDVTKAVDTKPSSDDLDFLAEDNNLFEQTSSSISSSQNATPQNNLPSQPSSVGIDDLDLASLGLDEEHKDPIAAVAAEIKKTPDPVSEVKIDDLDLNLDNLAIDDKPKNAEPLKPAQTDDEIDFGDLNLDSHEEVKTVDNVVEDKKEDDDLNFDDLDEELKKELEGHLDKVEENKNSTVKDSDVQSEDFLKDLNLPDNVQGAADPLGLNSSSGTENSDPLNFNSGVVAEEKNTISKENVETIFDSTNDLMKNNNSESKSDDLDFENELMGDGVAPSSFAAESSSSNAQVNVEQEQVQTTQKIEIIPTQKSSQVNNSINLIVDPSSSDNGFSRVLSEDTVKQVSDSVKRLVDAKNVVSGVANFSQSPALGEIAAQLMEPKIDKWFNDNLPELVEKIVREEIKKLIPKE